MIPKRAQRFSDQIMLRQTDSPEADLNRSFEASGYSAASARSLSIWPMASTTASKVSIVEACRAL